MNGQGGDSSGGGVLINGGGLIDGGSGGDMLSGWRVLLRGGRFGSGGIMVLNFRRDWQTGAFKSYKT